jgi:hypothetical protein
LPKGRTVKYIIWRVCERFKLMPPDIKINFNDNTSWQQAELIAYENIRNNEEVPDVKSNSKS